MTKTIDELTITDDFMFGALMRNPKLCKPLLELILNVRINHIDYPELQKTITERYGSKSIRLDVYVEDDAHTVYDVEIQTSAKRGLAKRTRYYQSMIDTNILEKGEDYTSLRRSFVIFICTYDPFGKGRYVYTFENRCREDLNIPLGDEATKVILNIKGSVGDISAELEDVLQYMDGKAPKGEYTKALDRAIADIRMDEDWRREYMVLNELIRENRRYERRRICVSQARKFRNRFPEKDLAEFCLVSPEMLATILKTIDTHPDWDDEQVAESIDLD